MGVKQKFKYLAIAMFALTLPACTSQKQTRAIASEECAHIGNFPQGGDDKNGRSVYRSCVDGRTNTATNQFTNDILDQFATILLEALVDSF